MRPRRSRIVGRSSLALWWLQSDLEVTWCELVSKLYWKHFQIVFIYLSRQYTDGAALTFLGFRFLGPSRLDSSSSRSRDAVFGLRSQVRSYTLLAKPWTSDCLAVSAPVSRRAKSVRGVCRSRMVVIKSVSHFKPRSLGASLGQRGRLINAANFDVALVKDDALSVVGQGKSKLCVFFSIPLVQKTPKSRNLSP